MFISEKGMYLCRARYHEIKQHSHLAVLTVKSWRKGGRLSMLCKDKIAELLAKKRSIYKIMKMLCEGCQVIHDALLQESLSWHHILKLPMTGKCFGDRNLTQRGTWIQVLYDMKNYEDLIILHILLGIIQ